MTHAASIPDKSYGILMRDESNSAIDTAAQELTTLGYSVLDAGYNPSELNDIANAFEETRKNYTAMHGAENLKKVDEHNTVRCPLLHGPDIFMKLAFNSNLMALLKRMIVGRFILNQQNGVINPPKETYNQAFWHRDLPYQHFVSTRPIAINALFCIDDFTIENGATFVLPATHLYEAFPSEHYIKKHAVQAEAKAGSFILLNCMTYHSGGFNATNNPRRAVNHVYTIPYFKQQINIPKNIKSEGLSDEQRSILGFDVQEPESISQYLATRKGKSY